MATETKPKGVAVGKKTEISPELKATAEAIFRDLIRGARDEAQFSMLALQAYKAAGTFLETTARIASGELSGEPEVPPETEYVELPVMVQGADESWKEMKDPVSGSTVMQKLPVDHYAYAPNLPASATVNRRFKPLDGVSFEERIAQRDAARAEEKDREAAVRRTDSLISALTGGLFR
jgi:hypothetical protein